jgi:enoyl-CoA hydratase/carnithine racemase
VTTPEYEFVTVEVTDGVGLITLNRPEQKNAMNLAMTGELCEAMWDLDADDAVRAIVVTGAGSAFCAGIDMSEGAGTFDASAHEEHNRELGVSDESITDQYAFWRMRTPTIAAINGAAVGAGLTMSLLFDLRIANEDAKLRLPFVPMNIIPDASSTWILPRLIGLPRTLELLFTGKFFTGAEAAEMGMVNQAVPADKVVETAMELARHIATYAGPLAAGVTKQLVHRALETDDRASIMTEETRLTWWAGTQPDTVEGVMALMTRGVPTFKQSKHTPIPDGLLDR